MSEKCFIQHDVENKKLRKENENENENENKNENENENELFLKNKIIKEELKERKSLNWFHKNKFKEIRAIIGSNEFNYKNKIDELKYIDIKDLVNNIKNNCEIISEISAKKYLNTLNKIKI